MLQFSTLSELEGHLPGGPRRFPGSRGVRIIVVAIAVSWMAACGARGGGPDGARPAGEAFSRPLEIYRDLGFMTGPGQFPAVASFATLAGPSDSTFVLLGMSLPNSSLRFQRDAGGFFAEYRIDVTFMDVDSTVVKRVEGREIVRVSTFAETGRTDESVVYQQGITVQPGSYIVRLQAADANSSRGFRMTDTLTVPDYARGAGVSSPVLVYEADGRASRDFMPDLITNPRHTVPFGGNAPRVYLEAYGTEDARPLDVRIVDEEGGIVWSAEVVLRSGTRDLRYGVVEVPPDVLPLGKFWVDVSVDGAPVTRRPLVMTISDQWMVANLDEVIQFLRYIAHPEELDSLRTGSPTEQRTAWDRFWDRRDPLPITDVNEYRDAFFQRVRYATEAFRETGGLPGWNTDRGEVFIVLGQPDNAVERYVGDVDMTRQPNAEEWVYTAVPGGRLNLLFYDRTGFGRYELVPSSEAAFRSVADRLKPRPDRN
ncbi:MAG: GWxTD domain-containing protein [Gemmatimonadetes bacterium]|nr:GWxTD domain-containing protein [Gemmatimonadota bacterium]